MIRFLVSEVSLNRDVEVENSFQKNTVNLGWAQNQDEARRVVVTIAKAYAVRNGLRLPEYFEFAQEGDGFSCTIDNGGTRWMAEPLRDLLPVF